MAKRNIHLRYGFLNQEIARLKQKIEKLKILRSNLPLQPDPELSKKLHKEYRLQMLRKRQLVRELSSVVRQLKKRREMSGKLRRKKKPRRGGKRPR